MKEEQEVNRCDCGARAIFVLYGRFFCTQHWHKFWLMTQRDPSLKRDLQGNK